MTEIETAKARARERAATVVRLILANGGWKYRAGIPMSDEEVQRQGGAAIQLVAESLLQLERSEAALRVADQVIRELGRPEYYQQRLKEAGL